MTVIIGGGPVRNSNSHKRHDHHILTKHKAASSAECPVRTTKQDLNIRIRRRQLLHNLLLANEPNPARPPLRRVIQHIIHREPLRVLLRELVELLLQQDVLVVDVRVDEAQLRQVERVFERGADDLEHGGDAGAAGDHAELAGEGGVVGELAFGPFDADFVADFEERDVAGDVTLFVGLTSQNGDLDRDETARSRVI